MQTLLIVEDDFDLNHAICLALEKEGYCIFSASSVESAKEICRKEELQLIILDVNLPDGNGFSFCDWVNHEKKTPVMFLTARDLEEDALAGYDMGAVDYVTKPFSMKILLKKIMCDIMFTFYTIFIHFASKIVRQIATVFDKVKNMVCYFFTYHIIHSH